MSASSGSLPDGSKILTAAYDSTVRLWDAKTSKQIWMETSKTTYLPSAVFSPDGETFLVRSGVDPNNANLRKNSNGDSIRTVKFGRTSSIISFSPDMKTILLKGTKNVYLYDVTTSDSIRVFEGHTQTISSAAFSPDGSRLLTTSWDGTARLWDVATGASLWTDSGYGGYVECGLFFADGKTIITTSQLGKVRLMNVATGEHTRILSGQTSNIKLLSFSPDGKELLTGGGLDMDIRRWDVTAGRVLQSFSGKIESQAMALSPDRTTLFTAGILKKFATLWNLETGGTIKTHPDHGNYITCTAYAPDGRTVCTGSYDKTVRLYDASTGDSLLTFSGHIAQITAIAFSHDGKMIATASADRTLRFWDPSDAECLGTIVNPDTVDAIAFSQDATTILIGLSNGNSRMVNIAKGESVMEFTGHTGSIRSVEFSPDERTILTGSSDKTARLWNVANGVCLRTFTGHYKSNVGNSVLKVAYAPNGKFIATGSAIGTVHFYDISDVSLPIAVKATVNSSKTITLTLSNRSTLNLHSFGLTGGPVAIDLFKLSGRVASRTSIPLLPNGRFSVNLEKPLPAGIYLYTLQTSGTEKCIYSGKTIAR